MVDHCLMCKSITDTKLVNKDGKPPKELVISFIPATDNQPGHFYVDKETFSVGQHGNDCLIHAAMKAAGRSAYIASDIRKVIAQSCVTKGHPCYNYIRSGIARNYVGIALIGAGRSWWNKSQLQSFFEAYGTKEQGIPNNYFSSEGKKKDISVTFSLVETSLVLSTVRRLPI